MESQGRWELERSGQAWSGQVGACKTEATAAEHMWRGGQALLGPWLSQAYICQGQIPELSKIGIFFVVVPKSD